MTTKAAQLKQRTESFIDDWRKFWSEPGFAILTLILMVAVFLFIIAPVFSVLLKSFGFGSEALTLEHYRKFFASNFYLKSLWNSVKAASISMVIIVFLSICMSLYVTRSNSLLARVYRGASLLPLVAPPVIFSLALIILFGRNGVLTSLLRDYNGMEVSIYGFG